MYPSFPACMSSQGRQLQQLMQEEIAPNLSVSFTNKKYKYIIVNAAYKRSKNF
jgi:hypothetical protein